MSPLSCDYASEHSWWHVEDPDSECYTLPGTEAMVAIFAVSDGFIGLVGREAMMLDGAACIHDGASAVNGYSRDLCTLDAFGEPIGM